MNFLGHAIVATRYHDSSKFALGAMLPDFLGMIGHRTKGSKSLGIDDAHVALGVRFHHVTDEVFHAASTTRTLMHSALVNLVDRGLPRGPARALAHVGVEIILDIGLAREPGAMQGYLAALRSFDAQTVSLSGQLERQHLADLVTVLLGRRDFDDVGPEQLLARLHQVFRRRPRLRWPPRSEPLVLDWLSQATESIPVSAPRILHEVGQGVREHRSFPSFLPP